MAPTMRVLLLGCGYLGRRVGLLLQSLGHDVHASTRRAETAAAFESLGWTPALCDVLSPKALECLPAFDAVVYAVGLDRRAGLGMREVYVEGLRRVLLALKRAARFVYVSSTSVYGQADGSWVDEDSATHPLEDSGQIVLEAEGVLRQALPDATILRFAGIYGPGRLLRQKAIEAGETIVGDAGKWLNLIHVDDGARAVEAALRRTPAGFLCNVCDGQPVTRQDFFTELARLLGAPPPRFAAPPHDAAAPPHERAHRRISNRRLVESFGPAIHYPTYREGLKASVLTG